MQTDPIIQELRDIRKRIEQACGNDARYYYQHLMEIQQAYQGRVIRYAPKPGRVHSPSGRNAP